MAGVSALLLLISFVISVSPGIHRRIKRQREYAGSWEGVRVAADAAWDPPVSAVTVATRLGRSGTWGKMKRMTRYVGRKRGRG
jgi:hypothetical protein